MDHMLVYQKKEKNLNAVKKNYKRKQEKHLFLNSSKHFLHTTPKSNQ